MTKTYVESTKSGGGNLPLIVDGVVTTHHRDSTEAMQAAGPHLIRGAKDVRWAGMVEYVFTLAEVDDPAAPWPGNDPELVGFSVGSRTVGKAGFVSLAIDHGGRRGSWNVLLLHGNSLIGSAVGIGSEAEFPTVEFEDVEDLAVDVVVQYETGERFNLGAQIIEVTP